MHSTCRTFSKTHVRTRAAQAPGSIARDPAAPAAATEQRGEAAEAVESKAPLPLTRSHQLSPAEGLAHGTCHPDARPGRPHGTGGGGRSTWNCRGEMAGHPLSDGSRPSADVWLGGWLVVLKGHGNRKALELWVNEDGAGRPRGGAAPPTPEPRQTLPTSAAAPRGPDGTPHSHGRARNWASRLRDSAKVPGHNGPPPALPSTETAKEPGRAPQAERAQDTEGRPCRDAPPPHTRCPRTEAPHARASAPLQPWTRRLSERKGACSRCGRAPRSPPTCLPGVPPPRHGEEEGAQQGHGDGRAAHRKNSALIVVAEDKKPAPENAHLCKRQTSHPLSRGWGGVKREKARRSHNNNKTGKKR